MNITEIRKLIKLVENSDIAELEVAEGETSIRISRQSSVAPVAMAAQTFAPSAPTAIATPASPSPEEADNTAAPDNDEHVVKSPMVGTFYRAPSPDADPFVNEGDKIRKGDTLCIIEAMKLMNEIEAEYDGVIDKILVNDATPLEFGQPIFIITPA